MTRTKISVWRVNCTKISAWNGMTFPRLHCNPLIMFYTFAINLGLVFRNLEMGVVEIVVLCYWLDVINFTALFSKFMCPRKLFGAVSADPLGSADYSDNVMTKFMTLTMLWRNSCMKTWCQFIKLTYWCYMFLLETAESFYMLQT